MSVTGNADTPLAPASGGSVPEPEYVNSFYGIGDDGKLIELDRDPVSLHSSVKPVPFYSAVKSTVQLKGAHASARLRGNAQFVVKGRSMTDPQTRYSLRMVKVSGDHREYTLLKGHATVFSGSTQSANQDDIPVRFENYGLTSYRIIPEKPLESGEYALGVLGSATDIYCFGVD